MEGFHSLRSSDAMTLSSILQVEEATDRFWSCLAVRLCFVSLLHGRGVGGGVQLYQACLDECFFSKLGFGDLVRSLKRASSGDS